MRKIKAYIVSVTVAAAVFLFAGSEDIAAQDSMMKKAGDKVVDTSKSVGKTFARGSKKTYRTGRRVGTTIGNRTWTGTKWVASNSWKGGKWVAVKTANGTKWVYRKGRNAIVGKPARRP